MGREKVDVQSLEDEAWKIYAEVEKIENVLDRVKVQTSMLDVYREIVKQLSDDRREDVTHLNKTVGLSYGTLADELEMTRGRIQQLVTGIGSPKRPGVIEMDTKVAMAEMEASGISLEDIVKELVPRIRQHRGGDKFSAERIADMLGVSVSVVQKQMRSNV